MQKCGCAGNYGFNRFKPIAAFEDPGIARFATRQKSERSRSLRPFLPNPIDFLIRFLELRNGGAPIGKEGGSLGRSALIAGNGEGLTHTPGQRISNGRARIGRRRKAETAKVIIHEVVAIPSAVILL